MDHTSPFNVCIIGAGVAGAAMAAYLGKNGLKVVVVEKSLAEMDRILGELLQPGGVQMLRKMGLGHCLENLDAQPVNGYGLFLNGESFRISYPVKEKGLTGFGFRNGKFVQNIRSYLYTLPNVTVIEGNVHTVIEDEERIKGIKYTTKEGEEKEILAPLTIVSDGSLSVFRNQLSAATKKVNGYFLGLILKNCDLPYPNHGHVIITDQAPVLLYPITSTETRALIDFPGDQPPRKGEELNQHLLNVTGKYIPASAKPSYIAAVEEGKHKVFPNHYLPAVPTLKKGAVLLGDSLNMRHPLTGGGMTVAFTDVHNLGNQLLEIRNWWDQMEIELAVKKFYDTRHTEISSINILADALYGVLRSEDLRDACYDYLKSGGKKASEPVSILSALSRDKQMLERHFFAVAFYGARNILRNRSGKRRVKRSYHMIKDAVHIISPLLLNEKPAMGMKTLLKLGKKIF